ncbi:MAG: FtsH protease activity modulator HflK [Alphaproteobacteria bacterium]|nr:FtsH protease activity modulator HflK [Alphaproteobacteria bacterium]
MKQNIINKNNGWNDNNQNPWGKNNQNQDFDNVFNGLQKLLSRFLPGGGKGWRGFFAILLILFGLWSLSGIYRVNADEQGVVLRFGKFTSQTGPGLHYHLPFPIETALTPKVTTVNRIDVGMRGPSGSGFSNPSRSLRDVPEESLMLTGDENIVDIDFSVFWVIKDASAFLFKIQFPERTIKAVSESAMREIVGNSDIQPILTGARQKTEDDVRSLMQSTLDSYGSGIQIREVKMQKVDPPSAVIDSFRDVQAARADQERARNEANAYANKIVPEAQGEASKILRDSEAYQSQTVAEAEGQATRFVSIYSEYIQAKDVTRQRMFLETMEKVFGSMNKIIVDSNSVGGQGVVPYLPLNEINKKGQR